MVERRLYTGICPIPQKVGGTVIVENGLGVMTGVESVEWYQIPQTYGFQVFAAVPFAPFRPFSPPQPPLPYTHFTHFQWALPILSS